jgi:hypothetical protein
MNATAWDVTGSRGKVTRWGVGCLVERQTVAGYLTLFHRAHIPPISWYIIMINTTKAFAKSVCVKMCFF